MSEDHDRLDGIFTEYRNAGPEALALEKKKKLFSDFASGLQRHIYWEEEILFPRFEEKTGMKDMGPTVVMRMEHRKIKEYLEQIQKQLQKGDAATEGIEEGLLSILTAHNEKEEKILYPWIDRELPADLRKEMLAKMK